MFKRPSTRTISDEGCCHPRILRSMQFSLHTSVFSFFSFSTEGHSTPCRKLRATSFALFVGNRRDPYPRIHLHCWAAPYHTTAKKNEVKIIRAFQKCSISAPPQKKTKLNRWLRYYRRATCCDASIQPSQNMLSSGRTGGRKSKSTSSFSG